MAKDPNAELPFVQVDRYELSRSTVLEKRMRQEVDRLEYNVNIYVVISSAE